jgi:hypothetical protein
MLVLLKLSLTYKPFMLNVVMLSAVMLNVVMLSVVMLNVVMLNVVMLNVVAPTKNTNLSVLCSRGCIQNTSFLSNLQMY